MVTNLILEFETERQERKVAKLNAQKEAERMAEEAYERMVNPEIFGGEKYRPSGHAGGFRGRLNRGQHYEQVQRDELEDLIAEKERESRQRERELERRARERDRERRFEDPRDRQRGPIDYYGRREAMGRSSSSRDYSRDYDRGRDR